MDSENNGDVSPAVRGNFVVLTWRIRLCYGVGHILNDLCANIWFTYLLLYLHEVVELSAVTAGSLLLIGQVADALATLFVGIESDRTGNVAYGRRKIWHLAGVCCVAMSFPFIFTECIGCEANTDEYAKIIYYIPFIVIFQFGWATTQISHLAMIPELSECNIEKVTLNAIRYAFTVSSGIVVFAVMWFLIHDMDMTGDIGPNDHKEFKFLAVIVVGIGLLFMAIYHFGVKEKPRLNHFTENKKGKRNAKNWKLWFKDHQFYKIGFLYMSTRLIVNISQVYIPLFTKITLQREKETIAIIPLVVFVSGFFTTFIAKPLNVRFGEKATYSLGLLIIVANWTPLKNTYATKSKDMRLNPKKCKEMIIDFLQYRLPFHELLRIGDSTIETVTFYNVWCHFVKTQQIYGFAAALGVGGSLSLVTCLAMLAKLIGENVETGAFVYGAMSFLDKLANGIAVQIIQIFHPTGDSSCHDCRKFYRYIMSYVPGVAAVLALFITATLLRQDIGSSKASCKNKEQLINPNASIQHEPYGACKTSNDPGYHKQSRRSSWESAKNT